MKNFEKDLKKMLEVLSNNAEEERRKSDAYKDMFSRSGDCESLLRNAEFKMTGIVLDACQVLKDKYGTNVSNEAFEILQALPLITSMLEKEIVEKEGTACCVDKVYYLLSDKIIGKPVKESEEANEG